jgi:hypothetical protein
MGINVKREDVVANVHLLASKLGLGITETIENAVVEKLKRMEMEREADIQLRIEKIREIQERLRPHIPDGATSNCDEFYDEDGLPA